MDKILPSNYLIKVHKHYFCAVLFIMLHKVVLIFEFMHEILKCGQWNAQSYWPVLFCDNVYYAVQGGSNLKSTVLRIKLKLLWHCFNLCRTKLLIVWICESVTIQMKAIEQYFLVVLFIMLYKVVITWVCTWNPKVWPFKWKLPSSTFLWYYLLCCTRWL